MDTLVLRLPWILFQNGDNAVGVQRPIDDVPDEQKEMADRLREEAERRAAEDPDAEPVDQKGDEGPQ